MTPKKIAPSELIINPDGSVFHLHLRPEQLPDRMILVGDPARVNMVASFFDTKDFEVSSREFHTIGGTYKGKPIACLSHGIGPDNIDIVINELDALANIDFRTREVKGPAPVSDACAYRHKRSLAAGAEAGHSCHS